MGKLEENCSYHLFVVPEHDIIGVVWQGGCGPDEALIGCCVAMVEPVGGYQGDPLAVPRVRGATVRITFEVRGSACLKGGMPLHSENNGEPPLLDGRRLRVILDGNEEADTDSARVTITPHDLASGTHTLRASLVVTEVEGGVGGEETWIEALVVTLADLEVLFPPDGFAFGLDGAAPIVSFSVSPTALARFCAGDFASECGEEAGREDATAVSLEVNGRALLLLEMKAEDGDDGRRTYTATLQGFEEGEYDVTLQLRGRRGAAAGVPPGAEAPLVALGDVAAVTFSIVSCARHGVPCLEATLDAGTTVGPSGGSSSDSCPQVSDPVCREDTEGCSGHGRCVDGVCSCSRDWLGPRCDVDLLNATEFFPALDPNTWDGCCVQMLNFLDGAREVTIALEDLHSPERCAAGLVTVYASRMHGLGAQVAPGLWKQLPCRDGPGQSPVWPLTLAWRMTFPSM